MVTVGANTAYVESNTQLSIHIETPALHFTVVKDSTGVLTARRDLVVRINKRRGA